MPSTNKLEVNELLFFITNKIHVTTKDATVDNCAKFYSAEEIYAAISALETSSDIRISKRNKGDKTKLLADIYDKLFTLDASTTKLPVFVAADLSRVPQDREDSDSLVSTEQLLASIQSLKQNMLSIQSQMVTKEQLRLSLDSHSSLSSESANSPLIPPLTPTAPPISQETSTTTSGDSSAPSWAAASEAAAASTAAAAPSTAAAASSAAVNTLRALDADQRSEIVNRQKGKMSRSQDARPKHPRPPTKSDSESRRSKNNPVVIGKKVSDGEMSWRGADLTVSRYIGRVALGTSTDNVKSLLVDSGVDVVSLEPLSLKHNRFLSYKLVIKKSQLPLMENPDIWPIGVLVGRWWNAKPVATIPDNDIKD